METLLQLLMSLTVLILAYKIIMRVLEAKYPSPAEPPELPVSDRQAAINAMEEELDRLHAELNSYSGVSNQSIIQEISKLNNALIELAKGEKK